MVRISCQCLGSIRDQPKLPRHVSKVSLLDPVTLDGSAQRKATTWKGKVEAVE